jgi:hypothetical protein
MTFDVMKDENRAIARRQLRNRLIERDAINDGHGVGVLRPLHYLHRGFAVFGRLLHPHAAFAKVHQDLIDRQTMQPRGEGRFAAKASYFAKELYEDLLGEVFSLRDVLRHPQA